MGKKIKKDVFKNILTINILILLMIFILLILAIMYRYFTYQGQVSVETSSNIKELYNNTNNSIDIYKENKEEKNKDIDSSITDWELLLVNKNNKIPDGYTVDLEEVKNTIHKVDNRIAKKLEEMLNDARKAGLDPLICSSYRTTSKQTQLYNNKVKQYRNLGYDKEKSEELASYWVAIPGTGEHETGLAVDIVSKNYQILDEKQEETAVQKWLMENSYKYGFALRYPTDKKEITMINYEPWHYRYVGTENAKYMKEHNMCLEEFIEYLKQFEKDKKLV